jgi:hypothetical protein
MSVRNWRIGFILASGLLQAGARAADPPQNLIRQIIQRETETEAVERNYTYEQSVKVEEFDRRGTKTGEYKEVRDIIFSPEHERTEQFVGKPRNSLVRLKLTDEDFRDLHEVQPFLLTRDQAFIYENKFRGEETVDGIDCWVVQIRPRQILQGQRLFDGLIWVDKRDFSIIRSEGEAVPQIRTTHQENLFPRFRTNREKVEGGYWFPSTTIGDDELQFKTGPQRIRLTIQYSKYKRFGADSTITFQK